MSDPTVKLGTLAPSLGHKDAIHVAVVAVVAGHALDPGDLVDFHHQAAWTHEDHHQAIGVVDPFLLKPVRQGELFWLLLKPGTVSSLRHVWAHPSFVEPEADSADIIAKAKSEAWLESWCSTHFTSLDNLIAGIEEGYVCFGSDDWRGGFTYNDDGDCDYELPEEFWQHYIRVTGHARPNGKITFGCSC